MTTLKIRPVSFREEIDNFLLQAILKYESMAGSALSSYHELTCDESKKQGVLNLANHYAQLANRISRWLVA